MKLSKLVIASTLMLGSLTSGLAMAKAPHPGGPLGALHFLSSDKAAEALELSEGQQSQIKAIADALRQEVENNRGNFKAFAGELEQLTHTSEFDEAKVREVLGAQQSLWLESGVSRARAMNQVWNLLSTEQQAKLDELKATLRHSKRQERRRP